MSAINRFLQDCHAVKDKYLWNCHDGSIRGYIDTKRSVSPMWAIADTAYLTNADREKIACATYQRDHFSYDCGKTRFVKHWDRWLRCLMEEKLHCRHPLIGEKDVLKGGVCYDCCLKLVTYVRFYQTPENKEYVFFEGFKSQEVCDFRGAWWDLIQEVEKEIKSTYAKELVGRKFQQPWPKVTSCMSA